VALPGRNVPAGQHDELDSMVLQLANMIRQLAPSEPCHMPDRRWFCLQEDEQNLKSHITALEDSIKDMTEDAANSARLYVTDEDIAKLPCTANDTVFAVKAPQGTTLEVPDPDDGLETGQRRYRYPEQHLC